MLSARLQVCENCLKKPMRKLFRFLMKLIWRVLPFALIIFALAMIWARFLPISTTFYMMEEKRALGAIKYDWISTQDLPIYIATSVMAGEDSHFCEHNGIEWEALQRAIANGGQKGGASTISQQMVKNLWLWHGQSDFSRAMRKGVEIPLTLFIEIFIPKVRIMELYLNIVEFDGGVFGIEAAAWHHYNRPAKDLTREQMARLAAVLPNPAAYRAVPPDAYVRRRAPQIASCNEFEKKYYKCQYN